MTRPLGYLDANIARLRAESLFRQPPSSPVAAAAGLVNLSSNDYLGFAAEPLRGPSVARGGAGASPLVVGTWPEHLAAEQAIADWLGAESATLYTSGYAANVGAISCLVGPGDLILSDRLNHASIIDGCRLSRARVEVFDHLDVAGVTARLAELRSAHAQCLVVTESYFSMDGDSPDLVALRGACDAFDAALYVDEAHALGVFGDQGRGLCAERGVAPDVFVGTLGKAIGLQGAFIAGARTLREWLWNRSRSLVFSTGVSPALAAAVPERVARLRRASGPRDDLHRVAALFRMALWPDTPALQSGVGPILPWRAGSAENALAASDFLRGVGVLALPIRPPTVPAGSARVRIAVRADLASDEVAVAEMALSKLREWTPPPS